MKVRLGIIAPRQNSSLFEAALSRVEGVEPRWVLYDDEDTIADACRQALREVDAAFFAGLMSLDRCQEMVPDGLPIAVARHREIDLAMALLRARDQGLPLGPASIDTFDEHVVTELADGLAVPDGTFRTLPYQPEHDVDDIVRFHLEARAECHTHYAVTGRSQVFARLSEKLDVPVLKSLHDVSSIRLTMNEAVLEATSARHSNLRFASAVYRVLDESNLYQEGLKQVNMLQMLLDSPQLADTWIEARGERSVLVFAHKGLLEEITHGWTTVPLIDEIRTRLGVRMAAGFGLGESARRSVRHAELALRRAIADDANTGFLMSEDGVIIGPMNGPAPALRYMFRTDNDLLRDLAHQVGLSPAALSRLADLERRLAGAAASAEEVSEALNVSVPSGRRIVRALRENGLAVPAGTAQPTRRGRPKNIYHLRIGAHLASAEPR